MTDSGFNGWSPVHGTVGAGRADGSEGRAGGERESDRRAVERRGADVGPERSYSGSPLPRPGEIAQSGHLPSPVRGHYVYTAIESAGHADDEPDVLPAPSMSTALERTSPVPVPVGTGGANGKNNSAAALSNALLLKQRPAPPTAGWRRRVFLLSGGRLNPGNSAKEQRRIELTKQINQPVHGCFTIAVLSIKGGVGKTTITSTLGSTFANLRGDRVIAVDANPDRGTLVQRGPQDTTAGVRDLLDSIGSLSKYSDVRAFTSQARSRLEVLASDTDPSISESLSASEYSTVLDLLERYYSIVVTDCGTGLLHSAMPAILQGANCLVVVSSGSVDGVRSASATLDWLDAHGFRELVANSVAVINGVRSRSNPVDMSRVLHHFEQRCRAVRVVPHDPHLADGGEISLDMLKPATRTALLELAAAVAQTFSGPPGRTALSRPGRGQDGWA
ncbi:MinD/ParA family ATP-binding protein [Millisia brevis]|uniref:MinD/ParA family ATP-binding protein n=1 Tax=Millisia brevis TaxID=264148 RepID=UPI000829F1BF|nr:MinD/ParA family protein [Millisia brevis]